MLGADGDRPLVGLVIVSHSAKVADGTLELASQMAGDEVRIVAAGGLEDGSIGRTPPGSWLPSRPRTTGPASS